MKISLANNQLGHPAEQPDIWLLCGMAQFPLLINGDTPRYVRDIQGPCLIHSGDWLITLISETVCDDGDGDGDGDITNFIKLSTKHG